jgi:acetyltransferase-like isoleucine patch superfamily enzyme
MNSKIGNGAVIGSHSVVIGDIPDFGIAVGVPAKVIKFRS